MTKTALFLASDHRGFALKAHLLDLLRGEGWSPEDLGTSGEARCDSLDFAVKLATALANAPQALGIAICGSGNGIAMALNRYRHIRAALCLNGTMARLARQHNDANVLALGAHVTGLEVAVDATRAFLDGSFLGGVYAARRDKLTDLGGL